MKYNDIIDNLQKLIYRKPTQQELAEALGLGQTAIAGRAKRNTMFSDDEIKELEKYFNIINLSHNNNFLITVNYYPDKIGIYDNKKFKFSENKIKYDLPASLFMKDKNKTYSMIHAKGNSMSPLISDNDFVVIEQNSDFINGNIYAFCYENEIYVNKLTKNINQIVVESENSVFKTQYIDKNQFEKLFVIGKVILSGKIINNKINFLQLN